MRILLTILVSSILTGCALDDSPRRVLIIETHTTIVRDTVRIDKYFKSEELYCKCGCGTKPSARAFDGITQLRRSYGKPITITSGARCEKHNRAVGGVSNSRHFLNRDAFDIRVPKNDIPIVWAKAVQCGFKGLGLIDVANGVIHIDMRDDYAIWEYK